MCIKKVEPKIEIEDIDKEDIARWIEDDMEEGE